MSIDRQFGVHELPGAEQPAPQMKRETVSAGFELQMRGYVNAIWAKLAELEGKIDDFEGWRTAIALALKDATGIDPRSSSRPLLAAAGDGGERYGDEFGRKRPGVRASPRSAKPWEAEGVSRRTWYRRQKGAP
jgi:hypothetical protein